jgi:hypothetical protein
MEPIIKDFLSNKTHKMPAWKSIMQALRNINNTSVNTFEEQERTMYCPPFKQLELTR